MSQRNDRREWNNSFPLRTPLNTRCPFLNPRPSFQHSLYLLWVCIDGALVLKMEHSEFSGLKSTVLIKRRIFKGNRHSYTSLMRGQIVQPHTEGNLPTTTAAHTGKWTECLYAPSSYAEILTLRSFTASLFFNNKILERTYLPRRLGKYIMRKAHSGVLSSWTHESGKSLLKWQWGDFQLCVREATYEKA